MAEQQRGQRSRERAVFPRNLMTVMEASSFNGGGIKAWLTCYETSGGKIWNSRDSITSTLTVDFHCTATLTLQNMLCYSMLVMIHHPQPGVVVSQLLSC